MAKTKAAAPAARGRVRKIEGVTITRIRQDGVSAPCALYVGDAPAEGEKISFRLENGITYTGTVASVTAAGEEVLIEFKDGIQPQK